MAKGGLSGLRAAMAGGKIALPPIAALVVGGKIALPAAIDAISDLDDGTER